MRGLIRKATLIAIAVMSLGALAWLPFVVMNDRVKAIGFGAGSLVLVVLVAVVPSSAPDGVQAACGFYFASFIIGAITMIALHPNADSESGMEFKK